MHVFINENKYALRDQSTTSPVCVFVCLGGWLDHILLKGVLTHMFDIQEVSHADSFIHRCYITDTGMLADTAFTCRTLFSEATVLYICT